MSYFYPSFVCCRYYYKFFQPKINQINIEESWKLKKKKKKKIKLLYDIFRF